MAKRKRNFEVIHNEHFEEKEFTGKHFTTHHLKSFQPATEPQSEFLRAFFQEQIPVILQVGSAGTGKTVMAMYAALSEVLDRSTPYDQIIVVRSAVQARDMGFLKGDETEKNEPFERAYQSICDELMVFKTNNYRNLKDNGVIKFQNTAHLRGLTFNNAILVVDEVQNMNYHELSTIMTRCGEDSRILFCGDWKQSDLHKKGDTSGLKEFQSVLSRMKPGYVHTIEYKPQHIVRSGIVREFLLAEERA